MIKLRLYQSDLEYKARSAMTSYKHVIAELGCGGGKSYTFADIVKKATDKGTKCLVLSHRLKILSQNNGALKDFGLDVLTINDHKGKFNQNKLLYACSIQTLRSRFDKLKEFIKTFGLIIIDECDNQEAVFLFESGIIDNTPVLGFTGTPYRYGNQRQLGIDWDIIVSSITVPELIDIGNVLPTRIFEVPFDPSSIKMVNGEYHAKSAFKAYDNPETYGGLLEAYNKHGENGLFIGFCTTIKHAIKNCLVFNNAGIKCKFVVSTYNKPNPPVDPENLPEMEKYRDRLETYNMIMDNKHLYVDPDQAKVDFIEGTIRGVFSIDILAVGFDFQPLKVCMMSRATTSKRLWIQMSNRVTRVMDKPEFVSAFPKKDYGIILDMGANRKRLGDVDAQFTWSLWHETSDTVGLPAMKECPKCHRNVLASMKVCDFRDCGYRFPTKEELRKVELVEFLRNSPDRNMEKTPEQLVAFAELKEHKKNWVFNQLWFRSEYIIRKEDGIDKSVGMDVDQKSRSLKVFRDSMRKIGYDNKFVYVLQKRYLSRR